MVLPCSELRSCDYYARRAVIITLFGLAVGPAAVAPPAAARADDSAHPWATVNVCDTADSPDTIGIRASMPGSRSGKEERYVRFVVQYFSREDDRWYRVAQGGDSGYLSIGSGRRARQFGRSFRIEPLPGRSVAAARPGLLPVARQGRVVRRASALTRKGHRSNTGDDPPGYSAVDVHDHVGLSAARAEQPRVVGDDAGDAAALELGDPRRVVDRPGVELAAGARAPRPPAAA